MDTAIDEAEQWVMGDSTTVLEKIAFLHWLLTTAFVKARMPDLDFESALRSALPLLDPDDQRAVLSLQQRAPKFKLFAGLLPTPGAHIASD